MCDLPAAFGCAGIGPSTECRGGRRIQTEPCRPFVGSFAMVTWQFTDRAHAAAGMWDALSLNRRLATTSAGVEMAIVAAFLGLRAVNVVQLAASLPTGLTQSPNPDLDALMVTAFVLETVVLAVVALRGSSLRLPRLIWADVSLGCVLLLGQKLISGPDLMLTWDAWGYDITLSCAMAAGFALRRRAETVVAAGALMGCYLMVTVNLSGSVDMLSTAATNSLSYMAFAGLGLSL